MLFQLQLGCRSLELAAAAAAAMLCLHGVSYTYSANMFVRGQQQQQHATLLDTRCPDLQPLLLVCVDALPSRGALTCAHWLVRA
jgi:hypothetical protein